MLAILLGVAIRTAWTRPATFRPGIAISAKFLLEVAVMLLGASVSVQAVLAIGPAMIGGIAGVVVVAIAASFGICRLLGIGLRMSILIACGNSICGNSAIAAVAPVIGADGDDVASSIAFTAVLGVVVVLALPLLVPVLSMSVPQYGALAGLTVYAVPQVLAATLPIGALANQVGTVVKLVRVLMLGPVVLLMSLLTGRLRDETDEAAPAVTAGDRPPRGRPALHELVPWFIVGFILVALLRTFGLIPHGLLHPIAVTATALTVVSMAALGLGVDVRSVARAGLRVTSAVTLSLIVLGLISLGLIYGLHVAERDKRRGDALRDCVRLWRRSSAAGYATSRWLHGRSSAPLQSLGRPLRPRAAGLPSPMPRASLLASHRGASRHPARRLRSYPSNLNPGNAGAGTGRCGLVQRRLAFSSRGRR